MFLFLEAGFHCVVQAGLSLIALCICLPRSRNTGMCPHAWQLDGFSKKSAVTLSRPGYAPCSSLLKGSRLQLDQYIACRTKLMEEARF